MMGYTAGVSRGGSSFQSPEVHAHMQSRFAAAGEPGAKQSFKKFPGDQGAIHYVFQVFSHDGLGTVTL